MRHSTGATVTLAGLLFAAVPAVAAVGEASVEARVAARTLAGEDWTLAGARIAVAVEQGRLTVHLTADTLDLPDFETALRALDVRCHDVVLYTDGLDCRRYSARFTEDRLGEQTVAGRFRSVGERVSATLVDLALGDGRLSVRFDQVDEAWTADLAFEDIDPLAAAAIASVPLPEGMSISAADLDGTVQATGLGDDIHRIEAVMEITGLAGYNDEGTVAAEGVDLSLRAGADLTTPAIGWRVDVTTTAGQAYAEPVLVTVSETPVALVATGRYAPDGTVDIHGLRVDQANTLRVQGRLTLVPDEEEGYLADGELAFTAGDLDAFYEGYVKPALFGTPAEDLDTLGAVAGNVRLEGSEPTALDMTLTDVYLDDRRGRFAVYGMNGDVHWRADGESDVASRLGAEGGFVAGVGFGGTEARLKLRPRGALLLEPTRVLILDGALLIRELDLARLDAEQPDVLFDAALEPLSLSRLATAFGWPPLQGTLSGNLPALTYAQGEATLDGALEANVFGGRIRVADLRAIDPLGTAPQLAANITIDDLDLELVTSVFEFGLITGRLEGHVKDLLVVNWKAQRFDAVLQTPPGDKSRHRISQRAVDHISSIGGGGAATALSGTFLRFFEDFAYRRLGISCRLQNGLCRMRGVGQTGTGDYYIVEGRGLPRIDVVGRARDVDWPTLVKQLTTVDFGSDATFQ